MDSLLSPILHSQMNSCLDSVLGPLSVLFSSPTSSAPLSTRLTQKPSFVPFPLGFAAYRFQMGYHQSWVSPYLSCILLLPLSCCPVEDQKELPSPVNPELRHKEVQMNFFNQLTSVFNPDITILSSPSVHMQVSKLHA